MAAAPAIPDPCDQGGSRALPARFELLAVDDHEEDLALLRHALRAAGPDARLETVGDGQAALSYLRREGAYAEKPRPALVIIDLHMPRMDGLAFLAQRRADPRLREVPVVVLTSSSSARDMRDCYAGGADCFITKPSGFEEYCAVLRGVTRFWGLLAAGDGADTTAARS